MELYRIDTNVTMADPEGNGFASTRVWCDSYVRSWRRDDRGIRRDARRVPRPVSAGGMSTIVAGAWKYLCSDVRDDKTAPTGAEDD